MSDPTNELTEPQEQATDEPESHEDEQTTYDAEYVKKLRDEAAQHRTAAREAGERGDIAFEGWRATALQQAAADLLRDVGDMPADDPRYYNEAGFPDMEGMRTVAEELVTRKPYLARVAGDVKQGAREATTEPSFGELLRQAVR